MSDDIHNEAHAGEPAIETPVEPVPTFDDLAAPLTVSEIVEQIGTDFAQVGEDVEALAETVEQDAVALIHRQLNRIASLLGHVLGLNNSSRATAE